MPSNRWSEALRVHGSAVAAFASAAEAVEPESWYLPRAEGKWSPAQIADHLIRSYDVLLREIRGGAGMRIRTRAWMRILLRHTYMRRILRGGWFPAGVPAPSEIRPAKEELPGQASAVALFRQRAEEFERTVREQPPVRMTHPYFGVLGAEDGVLLCARHIEHHRGQLP